MKEIASLKKGNFFHNGSIIYKIIDNDTQKKVIKMIRYEIFIDARLKPRQMRLETKQRWSISYHQLEKNVFFTTSVEIDKNTMQNLIMGVFGDII